MAELLKDVSSLPQEIQDAITPETISQLQAAMSELEAALLRVDAALPGHLQASHRLLTSYPESVHLLTDEGVHQLIRAAQEYTKTKIIADKATKKSTGGRSKMPSIEDL